MKSFKIAVCIVMAFASATTWSEASFGAFNTNKVFEKDITKICPKTMTVDEKLKAFARIGNIGASFSHGCMQCEILGTMRSAFEHSNDEIWLRRNYLLHFLSDNLELRDEGLINNFIVTEDDPTYDIENVHGTKSNGYDGRWFFSSEDDRATVLPETIRQKVINNPDFKDEGAALYGPMKGVIYQALPNPTELASNPNIVLIDFASDGARSFEMLKNHGDQELFKKLVKDGWSNEEDRERLIEITVKRIEGQKPSVLFLTDTLFWDTIPRTLYYAKQKGMNSTVLNILNNPLLTNKIKHTRFYGEQQEKRMHDDFFEAIARISRGHYFGKEIPVVMARLIDNPAAKFVKSGLGVDFAKILSSVIFQVSGIRVTEQMVNAFENLSLEDLGYNIDAEMTEIEVAELSERQEEIIANILSQNASLPGRALTRLSGPVLSRVRKSLPLLLQSLDKAFAHMNFLVREVAAQKNNNISLVSADRFFLNIHNLLHPGTIHPHVEGSRDMANLAEEATCRPNLNRDNARQYLSKDSSDEYVRFRSQRDEIYPVLKQLIYETGSKSIRMNGSKFQVTSKGWTKKDGVTTVKGSLKQSSYF